MDSSAQKEYDAFMAKVKRTIYIDNLSPQVNESAIRNGLEQFATVKSVKFIPNYTQAKNTARCALVEVADPQQARQIIDVVIRSYPFMILGIPRPVRARPAEPGMFDDRPKEPNRRIQIRWLDPNEPDFQVAKKLKRLAQKHAAEASYMLKQQLAEEEKLAKQHSETLKANNEKYSLMDRVMGDGSTHRLAKYYNVRGIGD